MSKILLRTAAVFLLLSTSIIQTFSQTPAVCRKEALAALRPIPKLKYRCRQDLQGYDEKMLKLPERVSAIKRYETLLAGFTSGNWWNISVNDLNVCDFRKKPGALSQAEKDEFEGGSYLFNLFGNNQIRVISTPDPCYQEGYGGSNVFLLYRKNGRVFATEIIDGFFSRADNPIFVDFATQGGEPIIEISSTSGGLYPTITNYYFTIDKRTNRAVPKNLFEGDNKKLSNEITSMMLLGDSEEYGLPANLEPLQVLKNNRLTRSFDVFIDTGETFGEDKHQKFTRQTLRWNGKFYE